MTNQDFFRSKEEELQHLIQEISNLKTSLKEISGSLTRIEKHVKRSFGVETKRSDRRKISRSADNRNKKEQPTMTAKDTLILFDELSEYWANDGHGVVEDSLQKMLVADLKLMAHELGVTFKSKPSKKDLIASIMRRLNERALLSTNINITPSEPSTDSNN